VTPYSFVYVQQRFGELLASILRLIMEAVLFLQNFGADLLNYITSRLRKPMFSRLPQ